ncbi:ABC transporter permease [Anaerotalea alkaliphila]|nr:ABC transporter permease [Anaerotalea alkaliphila]
MANINLGKSWKEVAFKLAPLLSLVILSVYLTFASSNFLKIDNMMNILRQASTIALVALGMLIVIITAGIDLSVGSILALSIVTMGVALKAGVTNPLILVLVCVAVGIAFGVVNGLLLTKLNLPHPFISTIGTRNIGQGLALLITGAAPIIGFPKIIEAPGAGNVGGFPVSFLLVLVAYVLVHIMLNNTVLGRQIYSIGGNKEAAIVAGINVKRVLLFVYGFSGFMCSLAGIIYIGRVGAAIPLAGPTTDMDAIAAVIIGGASFSGGKGTVSGTMIGVLLIALIRNGLNLMSAASDLQYIVIGLVIIIAVFADVVRTKVEEKARRLAKA